MPETKLRTDVATLQAQIPLTLTLRAAECNLNDHTLPHPDLVPREKLEVTSKLTCPQKSRGGRTGSKSGDLGHPCQNHPAGGM